MKESYSAFMEIYFKNLIVDFKNIYSNIFIVKWSLWWAFASCANFQIGNYTQTLWGTIIDVKHSDVYNGFTEALCPMIGIPVVLLIQRLQVDWHRWGELCLAVCSLIDGLILLLLSKTTNLFVMYGGYIIYRVMYQAMITITQSNLANCLTTDSFGLVFGLNTFVALVLQTLLTLVVTSSAGLALSIRLQREIIATYFLPDVCRNANGMVNINIYQDYFLTFPINGTNDTGVPFSSGLSCSVTLNPAPLTILDVYFSGQNFTNNTMTALYENNATQGITLSGDPKNQRITPSAVPYLVRISPMQGEPNGTFTMQVDGIKVNSSANMLTVNSSMPLLVSTNEYMDESLTFIASGGFKIALFVNFMGDEQDEIKIENLLRYNIFFSQNAFLTTSGHIYKLNNGVYPTEQQSVTIFHAKILNLLIIEHLLTKILILNRLFLILSTTDDVNPLSGQSNKPSRYMHTDDTKPYVWFKNRRAKQRKKMRNQSSDDISQTQKTSPPKENTMISEYF
uniref:CUB_2 domain-containing protein n=1 Tax=Heterorhabditis bacteriophora TaxID=37862 RepID=A0A1I7XIK5_HETBA